MRCLFRVQTQRSSLKNSSLSRMLCDNTGIKEIQKNTMLLPSTKNPKVSCDDIPRIDLNLWKENSLTDEPKLFTQSELNDLVRDLDLPKDSAEVLGSKLKEKKLLALDHKWAVWGDLKVISMLLGQQKEYMKFPCFLSDRNSRDRKQHYIKKEYPIRRTLDPGDKNTQRENLVDPKKVLLPPLHIKLGLMKQFVKALTKEGECFKYLCDQFPCLSEAKLKDGVFVGPDRKMMNDEHFETKMKTNAWKKSLEIFQISYY
ncbi:hypothetical protein AVEN_230215-1 [Araneus ventricosus]|uniref:Uncharacterized protein n=1 Tax=Araneus ventricosus TaxID=182803 RepID=A0A4Y2DX82_ARAVE|nr:hypothetical protein AVEN_230215-1 [Araneus ventricosus]